MINPADLQKYSLFGGIPEEEIHKIIPYMTYESYKAGDTVLAEGSINDKIHFLLEGTIVVIKGDVPICELTEGNTFGEMEVLDVMPSAAAIKAVTSIKVMSMSNKMLRQIYHDDLKSFALMVMNLARDLSRRLRMADDKITERQFLPASRS